MPLSQRLPEHAFFSPYQKLVRRTSLEGQHVGNQRLFLLLGQFRSQYQVEELDRVGERNKASVMQVGRRILDAAQREGLDWPVGQHNQVIHGLAELVKSLKL